MGCKQNRMKIVKTVALSEDMSKLEQNYPSLARPCHGVSTQKFFPVSQLTQWRPCFRRPFHKCIEHLVGVCCGTRKHNAKASDRADTTWALEPLLYDVSSCLGETRMGTKAQQQNCEITRFGDFCLPCVEKL